MLAAAAAILHAGAALGQTPGDGFVAKPMAPSFPWASLLYILVALLGICVVGFKKSKRTHLD